MQPIVVRPCASGRVWATVSARVFLDLGVGGLGVAGFRVLRLRILGLCFLRCSGLVGLFLRLGVLFGLVLRGLVGRLLGLGILVRLGLRFLVRLLLGLRVLGGHRLGAGAFAAASLAGVAAGIAPFEGSALAPPVAAGAGAGAAAAGGALARRPSAGRLRRRCGGRRRCRRRGLGRRRLGRLRPSPRCSTMPPLTGNLALHLVERRVPMPLTFFRSLERLERTVGIAVVDDGLRLHRTDARQRVELLLGRGVDVDGRDRESSRRRTRRRRAKCVSIWCLRIDTQAFASAARNLRAIRRRP